MLGSWRRIIGWFLLFILLSVISILVDAYLFHPVTPMPKTNQQHSIQGHVAICVPSVIANLYSVTKRQFLQRVDLRRAEVRIATQPESLNTTKPLMDKVLVVPKSFRGV